MNFAPIDSYLARVKQLTATGGKDMRLSFQEANLLAISLAELLSQLRQNSTTAKPTTPLIIDGGTFAER